MSQPNPKSSQTLRSKRRRLAADWFRTDAAPAADALTVSDSPIGSLRDYLARRLEEAQAATGASIETPDPGRDFALIPAPQLYPCAADSPERGRMLNGVDTEMNAGIEHLLPTPSIRLRVVKDRLVRERAELELKLAQYDGMERQTPAIRQAARAAQERLKTLRQHERQIDAQIKGLFLAGTPDFLWSDRFKRAQQAAMTAINVCWRVVSLQGVMARLNRAQREREALQARLRDLSQMLAAQQAARQADPPEVSDIINAYDRTLSQLEALRRQAARPGVGAWARARLSAWMAPWARALGG